jgi:hypothetical protein
MLAARGPAELRQDDVAQVGGELDDQVAQRVKRVSAGGGQST